VRFTEVMSGAVTPGESDPRAGGNGAGAWPLLFKLTIHVDDLDPFLADPEHEADATGYVECPALGGRHVVSRGWFNLFTTDGDPRTRHMRYRLHFRDSVGSPLTLAGVKDVHDDPGHDAWGDTTTLFTRILPGHVMAGEPEPDPIASGIIRISPRQFARQVTTFRGAGPGLFGDARAVGRFGESFLGALATVYGRRLLGGG
jgi:cholesterol oxidase